MQSQQSIPNNKRRSVSVVNRLEKTILPLRNLEYYPPLPPVSLKNVSIFIGAATTAALLSVPCLPRPESIPVNGVPATRPQRPGIENSRECRHGERASSGAGTNGRRGCGTAAGRAGGGAGGAAAAGGETALDAARVEAVPAGRQGAHGVPVRELRQADRALRRAACQLRPGRRVHRMWKPCPHAGMARTASPSGRSQRADRGLPPEASWLSPSTLSPSVDQISI